MKKLADFARIDRFFHLRLFLYSGQMIILSDLA